MERLSLNPEIYYRYSIIMFRGNTACPKENLRKWDSKMHFFPKTFTTVALYKSWLVLAETVKRQPCKYARHLWLDNC